MDYKYIGGGGWGWAGGGWGWAGGGLGVGRGSRPGGTVGGFFRTFEQKSSHCVFIIIRVHRQPQFTSQAGTVADSSLTPSVALLVRPRGTTHSTVDCHEFTGSQK